MPRKPLTSQQVDEPMARTRLVDQISARLKTELINGRYKPGDVLPAERELAGRMGVTRTSLRQALVGLEELGLIKTHHGVGSVVQDALHSGGADLLKHFITGAIHLDDDILAEILEARTLIVAQIARLAARRRTDAALAELDRLIAEIQASSDDPAQVQRLEFEVVRALSAAGDNRAFVLMTNSVSAAYHLRLDVFSAPFEDGARVAGQLRAIVDAVRARDQDGARRAAEDYFEDNSRRVLASLSRIRRKQRSEP